jgi:hypothetical protein
MRSVPTNLMPSTPSSPPISGVIVFLFLTMSLFGTNFLLSSRFGLYEDDIFFFRNAFNTRPRWSDAEHVIITFRQGRPISHLMPILGQLTVWATQSLFATYVVSCVLLGAGLYVWFKVFCQRHDFEVSLLTSLFVILLPLHTVTAFLTGSLIFSVAAILSGIAILLIIRGTLVSTIIGYFCAFLVLMTYESFFPLIYAAPLFSPRLINEWKIRQSLITIIVNTFVLTIILTSYVAFREFMGERTSSEVFANHGTLAIGLWDVGLSALIGFTSSFRYIGQIIQERYLTGEHVLLGILIGGCVTIFYLFLLLLRDLQNNKQMGEQTNLAEGLIRASALIILGYVLTYFILEQVHAVPFVGRISRVNIAGAYGHSLLLALIICLAWRLTPTRLRGTIRAAILLPLLIALSIERIGVQSEYVSFWEITKEQLREIILLTPDVTRGTGILLEGDFSQYRPIPAIGYEVHGIPFLVDGLFDFPAEEHGRVIVPFDDKPIVERVMLSSWPMGLEYGGDGRLTKKRSGGNGWNNWPEITYHAGNVIHLKQDGTFRVTRSDEQIRVDNIEILKTLPPDPLSLGFWDRAIPRPTLRRMMPDFEMWFTHYQRMRADARASRATGISRP